MLAFITSRGVGWTAHPIALCVTIWCITPISSPPCACRHAFHADRRHRGRQRPYHLAKGQPQAWPHRKGTPVFGNVQGAHSARHGNGICQTRHFSLPQSTLSTGTTIGTNQFGKLVRKYEWNGTEEAIHQRLAEILRANFTHYSSPPCLVGKSQAQPQQGAMLSLFDLFGKPRQRHSTSQTQRKRPYTDEMPGWMKDGCVGAVRGGSLAPYKAEEPTVFPKWPHGSVL